MLAARISQRWDDFPISLNCKNRRVWESLFLAARAGALVQLAPCPLGNIDLFIAPMDTELILVSIGILRTREIL